MRDEVQALLNAADTVTAKNLKLCLAEVATQQLKKHYDTPGSYRQDDGTLVEIGLFESDRLRFLQQIDAAPRFAADLEALRARLPSIVSAAIEAAPAAKGVIQRLEQSMLGVLQLGGKATLEDKQPMLDARRDLRLAVDPLVDHPFRDDRDYGDDVDEVLAEELLDDCDDEEDTSDVEGQITRSLKVLAFPTSAGKRQECLALLGDFFRDFYEERGGELLASSRLSASQQRVLNKLWSVYRQRNAQEECLQHLSDEHYRSHPFWEPVRSYAAEAFELFQGVD